MELIVQGRRAYAYTGGKPFDARLPCVVFIHGAQHDHSVWGLQTRWFAHHGHGVLAFDLPAHGRSEGVLRDDGTYGPLASVEAAADWVAAALEAAGVIRACVVGHSMGSLIALETAARHPARVARLALVGTAYPMKVSDASSTSVRAAPVVAFTSITRYTWCPRWLYSNVTARESARHASALKGRLISDDLSTAVVVAMLVDEAQQQAVRAPIVERIQNTVQRLQQELREIRQDMLGLMSAALDASDKAVSEGNEQYVISGERNLLAVRDLSQDMGRLRQLFELFEHKTQIMQILESSSRAQGVQIFIGGESGIAPLDECSVVTAPYELDGHVVGTVGVIGPTRINYARIVPMVDYTAKVVARVVGGA